MPAAEPDSTAGLQDRLLDSIAEAVISTTPDGVITYWNRAAEQLYGWGRSEAVGRNIIDVVVGEDVSGGGARILETVAAGGVWSGDFLVRRHDGTRFIAHVTDTPMLGPGAELLGITGVSYDVSQRRLDEAKLQRARAIVAATQEAVIVLSVDGTVLDWNGGAEQVYGEPAADVLGRHVADIWDSAGALELWLDVRDTVLATGHASFDSPVLRADGVAIHVSGSVAALRNGAGEITELVGISRDVSAAVRLREESERSRRALEEAQRLGAAGSWEWDVPSDTLTWSDHMYRLCGLDPDTFVVTFEAYMDLVHVEDRERLVAEGLELLASCQRDLRDVAESVPGGGPGLTFDHRVIRTDGELRWMASTGEVAARDDDGKPIRLRGHLLDITDRKTLEHRLRDQRDALAVHAAVLESTDDAVIVTSLEGTITSWNAAAARLYGYTAAEAVGQSITLILDVNHAHRFPEILQALDRGAVHLESLDVCKDGSQLLTSVTISYVRVGEDPPTGVVGIARDITEQKRTREREQAQTQQLAHLAFHDPLTSLANRALLRDRLAQALVARRGGQIGVLLLDVDDFKGVNDVSGHAAGDRLLVEVAARLRVCVRAEDTVARLGGDEFAVLVESEEAEQVAERILDELSRPLLVDDRLVVLGVSIGIAYSDAAATPEAIMMHADVAMYAAKAAGKGRVLKFLPSMAEGVRERADLHDELRPAVARGEIVVHYQPVVNVRAAAPLHLEALVRWQRGDAFAAPGVFLGLAEASGLILGIGLEVLRRTCEQLHGWLAEDEQRSVAVNVSVVQLAHPDFAEQVPRLLASSGIRPAQLVLEVTESLFLDPSPALIDQLMSLRTLGVRVAIDDFGTGYSSLGRLQTLPVDCLKIDKSFVELIRTGTEDLPIITSIILMAHSLGLEVTAEGVETQQQAARLVALGCDDLQGYYFARPQPAQTALTTAVEQAAATFSAIVGGHVGGSRSG